MYCRKCGRNLGEAAWTRCPCCGASLAERGITDSADHGLGRWAPRRIAGALVLGTVVVIAVVAMMADTLLCADRSCLGVPVEGGRYCLRHTCPYPGCTNYSAGGYCFEHDDASPTSASEDHEPGNVVGGTIGQRNALGKARSYLSLESGFSKEGLVDQLEYEGFSESEAQWAVERCGADWDEQAAIKARRYLDLSPMSRSRLADQLEYEGFTSSEIAYALDAVGY